MDLADIPTEALCEGLDERRRKMVFAILVMITWVRAFYSEVFHIFGGSKNSKVLSVLGAIATAYRGCYRDFAHLIGHPPDRYDRVYYWIEQVRDYVRRKGCRSAEAFVMTRDDHGEVTLRPVTALDFHHDIMSVYEDFRQQFIVNKKSNQTANND